MYLEDQASSIHTLKAFIGDLNLLASYMPPDQQLGSITTNDLNSFLDWMQHHRGVPCKPKNPLAEDHFTESILPLADPIRGNQSTPQKKCTEIGDQSAAHCRHC